jgi:hypothetical protein
MTEKKRILESEVMSLPPLHTVLGDVPSPDPDRRSKGHTTPLKNTHDMIVPVKRIIAHLKNQK